MYGLSIEICASLRKLYRSLILGISQIGVATLKQIDIIHLRRESWDNFRTASWIDIIDYPELTLKETKEVLAFQGGAMYA